MDLYGFEVEVVFLIHNDEVLAYAWHYDERRALKHLKKIMEYHNLKGKIKKSIEFEKWLKEEVDKVVVKGAKFTLPDFEYQNRFVYENIIKIPRSKIATYAQIARISSVKYTEMLKACHRLLTNKGSLFGYYPLGKEVKRKLLEIEGVRLR